MTTSNLCGPGKSYVGFMRPEDKPNSTPTTAPRTMCDHCLGVSVYSRRDTAGNTHRSCVVHTSEMEILVREINEWDREQVFDPADTGP